MNLKTLGQRLVMFDGLKSWSVENAPEYAWTRNNLRADDASFGVSMAYRAVGAVFRGVQLRANAVARMPRYIYRGSEVVPEDDPSLDFIGNLTDLLWRVEASLCLYAASYLWKARNTVRLRELRWFATNTITPDVDPSAGLRGFRRSVGNIPYYQPNDLAYLWLPSVDDEVGPGVAPAQAALISAGIKFNIDVFISSFFERGAVKPVLLYSPDLPSKEQKEEFETWAERMVMGIRNAFRLRVLRWKVEKLDIADKLNETLPVELPGQVKEDIATALGIPYSLLFSDAANYATAQQDDKHFYDKTVTPDVELIGATLNRQVFEPLGLELYFAPEELEMYQANESDRATSLSSLTLTGVPVDVGMVQLGYDLSPADAARIKLASLTGAGATYDNARAYILDRTEDDDLDEVTAVLDLFAPAEPLPTIPPAPDTTESDIEQTEEPDNEEQPQPDQTPSEEPATEGDEDGADTQPVKTIKAAPLEPRDGVMVGFFLDTHAARQIAPTDDELPDGSVREEALHMTLVYLSSTNDLAEQRQAIADVVRRVAEQYQPVAGTVNGYGRFQGVGEGGADALIATFDSTALPELRQMLFNTLRATLAGAGVAMEDHHGFTPHITLAYVPAGAPVEMTLPSTPVTFPAIALAWGNEHAVYPFTGQAADVVLPLDEPGGEMKADLERWERKALKRLKGDKPAACEFESEHIGDSLSAAIAGALESAETADEVKHLFASVPMWEVYP